MGEDTGQDDKQTNRQAGRRLGSRAPAVKLKKNQNSVDTLYAGNLGLHCTKIS